MKKNLSALLTAAVVTGLLTAQVAKAEDTQAQTGNSDQSAAAKKPVKGAAKDKAQNDGKNSCKGKNACGEKKAEKTESK